MAIVQVGPDRELKTLQAGFSALRPGDTLQCDPGDYAGASWYADGPGPDAIGWTTKILGGPGVRITSGNSRSQGISIEGRNGVVIDGFRMSGLGEKPQGCGVFLAGCSNVLVKNVAVDLPREFGANISCCHNVVVEDCVFTRARFQHGVYVGNSSTNCTIKRCKFLGNKLCGIQANGDMETGSFWGFPNTGEIRELAIEDCTFGWNGVGGGADINLDSVVKFQLWKNNHLPTNRGKGNGVTFFRSSYNPGPTRSGVVMDCNIAVGAGRFNCLRFEEARDIVFDRCSIAHSGWPARSDAGWIELFIKDGPADVKLQNVTFRDCEVHGAVVIQDALAATDDLGASLVNTWNVVDLPGFLGSLPDETDPGEIVAPPPPAPDSPGPMPANGEAAASAAPEDVDLSEFGGVRLREWDGEDRFGEDYAVQSPSSHALPDHWFDFSPLRGTNRNNPGFSNRWEGYWRSSFTGLIEVRARGVGGYDASFAGVAVLSGQSLQTGFEARTKAFRVEAGRFYRVSIGLSTKPDTVPAMSFRYRAEAAPDSWRTFDVLDLYKPKSAAPVPGPDPEPEPGPNPEPSPGPSRPGDDIVIRISLPRIPDWLKAVLTDRLK